MMKFIALFWCLMPLRVVGEEAHEFQYVTIEGNQIAWSCEGEGEPTIVLVAGMGLDAHASFSRTYHNYKGPGRICMYDRAGMGNSEFRNPTARTLVQLSDELHEVITRNGWSEILLVAHSFAGFIVRAYVSDHPDAVKGLLLLDTPHENWLPILKRELIESDWQIMERIVIWSLNKYHEDFFEAQEAVRLSHIPDDLPLTVISRGIPHTQIRLEKMSYEGIDLFDGVHGDLQHELAGLSSKSEHRVAKYSSHMIDNFDPWLVIGEIESLLGRVSD